MWKVLLFGAVCHFRLANGAKEERKRDVAAIPSHDCLAGPDPVYHHSLCLDWDVAP